MCSTYKTANTNIPIASRMILLFKLHICKYIALIGAIYFVLGFYEERNIMSPIILPEFTAMQAVAEAVSGLSAAEKRRVAAWLTDYVTQDVLEFAGTSAADEDDVQVAAYAAYESDEDESCYEQDADFDEPIDAAPKTYDTFAELYEAAAPKTGAQKAAVAGYWFETHEGKESWKASEVNKLLKQIGVKVSSVSIVLTNAVKASDPLIAQLARLGDGERSRKTFCLTDKGIFFVEDRLG